MSRKLAAIALVLAILIGFGATRRAEARPEVTLDVFYDALSPYGEWIEHEYYGYIWQPVGVDEYWKPYRDGNWRYSDEGWIWVSEEPWGWATYHYGRWVPDDYYGWVWIPGVDWAAAYVEWYESSGYIGWAPRPPDNNFFIEIGVSFGGYGYYQPEYYAGFDYYKPYYYGGHGHHREHYKRKHYYYDKHHYNAHAEHSVYVPYEHFAHKNAKLVALEGPQNTVVLRNARNITNVTVINNRTVYKGPDRYAVERRSGKKIKRVNVVDRDLVQLRGKRGVNQLRGNQYNVYRPKVVKKGYEKPHNISKRYNGNEDYKNVNNRRLEKKGVNGPGRDGVVNRASRDLRNGFKGREGSQKGATQKYSSKSRAYKAKSPLTPAKSNKQQINRDKISTQYPSSKHPQFEKDREHKSRVNRSSNQNRYKSKSEGNKLRSKPERNLVNTRKDNAKGFKNARTPYKASNKGLSPAKPHRSQAAYKSQKPNFNKARNQQKSFKSNKPERHVNKRNPGRGNSYKRVSIKGRSGNTANRAISRSPVNRGSNNPRGALSNPGNRSFNRQARR